MAKTTTVSLFSSHPIIYLSVPKWLIGENRTDFLARSQRKAISSRCRLLLTCSAAILQIRWTDFLKIGSWGTSVLIRLFVTWRPTSLLSEYRRRVVMKSGGTNLYYVHPWYEMGEECGTYGGQETCIQGFCGKTWKITLGRLLCTLKDNIKMYLQGLGWGGLDWIALAQDRDRLRSLVNAVMNTLVP
jgi:hypothetical protein